MDTQTHKNEVQTSLETALAYYTAMAAKNLSEVSRHLDPNVQFISPMAELSGKDAVLEAAKNYVATFKTLTIRAKFGAADQAMLAYDLVCPPPIGLLRAAVLMTVKKNLVTRIELFYDALPFQKKT